MIDWKKAGPWYVIAFGLFFVAVALAVFAIMEIAGLDWEAVQPWLAALGALVAGIGVLVAVSFAPPGPNWVQRALDIEAEPLMVVVGVITATVATVFWFDFGPNSSSSAWWILPLVAGGMLVLIAVLRLANSDDDGLCESTVESLLADVDRALRDLRWVQDVADAATVSTTQRSLITSEETRAAGLETAAQTCRRELENDLVKIQATMKGTCQVLAQLRRSTAELRRLAGEE